MRIVTASDIHGDKRAPVFLNRVADELSPDLLVIAGDITTFGPGSLAEEILGNIEVRCAAIPGNCDPDDVLEVIEKKCISLHGRRENIDGIDFVGLGGSPKSSFGTPREMEDSEIERLLSSSIVEGCVLVSHTPPRGINDLVPSGIRLGSEVIKRFVEDFRPRLVLSGHVHEARGLVEEEGTVFANPGPLKEGFVVLSEVDQETRAELVDMRAALKNL